MKIYFFAVFFIVGVLSQVQNNISNQTVQYSILKDPIFGNERDFRAQTIRVYDIVSQMLPQINKPLQVPAIFPSEAVLPPLNTVSVITPKQNELKTQQNVQPINSNLNTNPILQTPIQPVNNQIVLPITNQTTKQQQTIIPIQHPIVSPNQPSQKTQPSIQNTIPLSTIASPSTSNKSSIQNKTSSLINQSIAPSAAGKQNYLPIVLTPPKTQINNTISSPLNPQLITKQINEPHTTLWKGVPSTTTKQNNFKKFTNLHQPSKNNLQGQIFQHPSFPKQQQIIIQDKQQSSLITIILFVLIGITVVTIFGVGCMIMRKRRGKPVLFIDSTAIRQQIQTPKINKKGQYNPSQHQFIEMVEDSDMTHG